MKALRCHSGQRRRRGFTMVEIAIALAVIGFALVAIIGILPSGMLVQQENREETIITQDGAFWIEALRQGEADPAYFADQVEWVEVGGTNYTYATGRDVIGLLSGPFFVSRAMVRAISGSAAEKGPNPEVQSMAFRYVLQVESRPFFNNDGTRPLEELVALATNLYDLRVELRWPVLPNGDTGTKRKVFRTLVSGQLVQTNSPTIQPRIDIHFMKN